LRFAKTIFWIAAIWGFLIIAPLYFLFDLIGRKDPPPITHPGFFYGFVGLALAWHCTGIVRRLAPDSRILRHSLQSSAGDYAYSRHE